MAKGNITVAYDTDDIGVTLRNVSDALAGIAAQHTIPAAVAVPVVVLKAEQGFTDYGKFYDYLRGNTLLGPKITQSEFDGCDAILLACLKERYPVSYTSYAMATAYLETAHTMQPIKELGGDAYYTRMYDIKGSRPAKARELGNLTPGDGARYPGRGYVQLTGLVNYAKATAFLRALGYDVDLVKNPDLALRPDLAALIMAKGMLDGWFTGRKLSDDLPASGIGTLKQFISSRDIINGTDRQADVASYAIQFQTGLGLAGYHQLN